MLALWFLPVMADRRDFLSWGEIPPCGPIHVLRIEVEVSAQPTFVGRKPVTSAHGLLGMTEMLPGQKVFGRSPGLRYLSGMASVVYLTSRSLQTGGRPDAGRASSMGMPQRLRSALYLRARVDRRCRDCP